MKEHQEYQEYRLLSDKEKQRRKNEAKQKQEFRKPNPQGNCVFSQIGFIDFTVEQDGEPIKLQTYRHLQEGKKHCGVIFIFHGLNSHIGRGAHLAQYMSQFGFICVGFDHRGFGQSMGRKGFMSSLEEHLSDCYKFIEIVSNMYRDLPKFVMGESMGGMTSYYLTLQRPQLFYGAVMMAPALKNGVGDFLVGLAKCLGTILPKKLIMPRPFIRGRSQRNPEVTKCNENDPYLLKNRASISTLETLVRTLEKTPQTFKNYKSPFFIAQGGIDRVISPDGAFQLYDNCQTHASQKKLLFYENMWHDVWHEEEIYEIMEKAREWMELMIEKKDD